MVFYAACYSTSVISRGQLTLFMSFLGFTSTSERLGLQSVLPTKRPNDPLRLESRTPGGFGRLKPGHGSVECAIILQSLLNQTILLNNFTKNYVHENIFVKVDKCLVIQSVTLSLRMHAE